MKQNYNFRLSTLFSSICTALPTGNDFLVNDVPSLCQDKIKSVKGNLLTVFLLIMTVSSGQKSIAKNTPNHIFTSQKFIVNHILISSVTEGRGGGGGHGNADWVIGHPLDVGQVNLLSEILNTNDHYIYKT